MNIGIFVNTLSPSGASQRRFQNSILLPILNNAKGEDQYYILSYDKESVAIHPKAFHLPILRARLFEKAIRKLRSFSRSLVYHLRINACRMSPVMLLKLLHLAWSEPSHFYLIRHYNIRLLYNLNQHWLPVPIPFIQTVWDVNQRILSYYPEFSYTRYTFNSLDHGIGNSLAQSSYVITGTHVGASQLVNLYGLHPDKIRVLPFPAPQLTKHEHHSQAPNSSPYLFYPARLWPHKNHTVLFYALATLRDLYGLEMDLILIGKDEGNLDYLRSLAAHLGVDNQIKYLGEVDDSEISNLYCEAFALVFASPAGPDNLPPLEAMALGCPVIAAQTDGSVEQLGDAALHFSPYDAIDLAKKINLLHRDSNLRQNLITNGTYLCERLTAKSYASSVHEIIEEFKLIARNWPRCDQPYT